MHMADALLSPAVGGTMWAVSACAIACSSKKLREDADEKKAPLMGVLGAFLFAAQMINFTIPATGSSGHLGGGLLMAILLGPQAAFLTTASVLVVQALFFADGGLLALGCNVFNMGFIPAFLVYPFIYRKIIGNAPGRTRLTIATMISAVAGLQLGALGVVLETSFSGISSLPFSTFALFMQPIHLAIGIVEGFITISIISFVFKARPEILQEAMEAGPATKRPVRNVAIAFLIAALFTGGVISRFASANPDGLEWAIAKVTGADELKGTEQKVHGALAVLQEKIAFMPDYSFKKTSQAKPNQALLADEKKNKPATTVSGIAGGLMTLSLALLIGFVFKKRSQSVQADIA